MEDELERARRALTHVDAELDSGRVLSRVRALAAGASQPPGRAGLPVGGTEVAAGEVGAGLQDPARSALPAARPGRAVPSVQAASPGVTSPPAAPPETVEVAVLRAAPSGVPGGRSRHAAGAARRVRRPALAVAAALVVLAALSAPPRPDAPATPPAAAVRTAGPDAAGVRREEAAAADALRRVRHATAGGAFCAVRMHVRSGDDLAAVVVDGTAPPAPTGAVRLGDDGSSAGVLGVLTVEALRSLVPGGPAGPDGDPVDAVPVDAPPASPGGRDGADGPDGPDDLLRLRVTPSGPPLLDARVTRVEYLVDTATWLPRTQQLTVQPDAGGPVEVVTDLEWATCGV